MNCLRFMVSTCRTLAKCSGANVGIPSKRYLSGEVVSVSPMAKMPGSNNPMISPAYASSTMWRSSAIICVDWESLTLRPPCTWFTSMPGVYLPEVMRRNAMRSRCALFMLA